MGCCLCPHTVADIGVERYEVYIHPKIQNIARTMPHTTIQGTMCLLDITQETLRTMTEQLRIQVCGVQGHGRLGRIYRIKNSPHVCKVSSVDMSGTYEMHNYSILRSRDIPCPEVILSSIQDSGNSLYTISVLERMDFTLTALLRSCKDIHHIQGLDTALDTLLQALIDANLVYIDLSPDNIMFQKMSETTYSIRVIDPQFVTTLSDFERKVHRAVHFDRMYLALKIYIIGMMYPGCQKCTNWICHQILGYVPLKKDALRWLLHEGQKGVFFSDAQFFLQPQSNLP